METGRAGNSDVKERIVRIKLNDGTLINGQVNLQRDPGYERLSDLVADQDHSFLILFNATIYDISAQNPIKRNAIFVNKNHILWVEPDEDEK